MALKGGPWREASMVMLGVAFGLSKDQVEAMAAGQDVLSQGMGASMLRSAEDGYSSLSTRPRPHVPP